MAKGGGPEPPDPAQTAEAQAKANRVTTLTPYGSQFYGTYKPKDKPADMDQATWDAKPYDQRFQFEVDPSHDAVQLQETDQQRQARETNEKISTELGTKALSQARAIDVNAPINAPDLWSGKGNSFDQAMGGIRSTVDMSAAPSLRSSLGLSGAPQLRSEVETRHVDPTAYGTYERGVDTGGMTPLSMDPELSSQLVRLASYKQATDLLEPDWQRDERRLDQKLADQGLPTGGEAWQNATGEFSRGKDAARQQAALAAIMAGGQEASRLGAESRANRGMQFGEATTNVGLNNDAVRQALADAMAASNQNFGQDVTAGKFGNEARQQYTQEQLDAIQVANQARQQQLSELLAQAELANNAQAQGYGQTLNRAQFVNATAGQDLQNEMAVRNLKYNELANLLGGNQVQAPTLQQPSPIDITGAVNSQYQGRLANAQMANASSNATMGAGAAVAAAAIMM